MKQQACLQMSVMVCRPFESTVGALMNVAHLARIQFRNNGSTSARCMRAVVVRRNWVTFTRSRRSGVFFAGGKRWT